MTATKKPYDIGDEIVLTGTFTDDATSDPVDPGEVFFRVRVPDGTVVVLDETQVEDGVYTALYEPTQPGYHTYLCLGRDGRKAAAEGRFKVSTPRVPRPA